MTYSDKYSLLKAYKIATGDDSDKEASHEKGYSKEENKEFAKIFSEFQKLTIEQGTDIDKLKEYYKVDSTGELTIEQLKEIVAHLKGKVK